MRKVKMLSNELIIEFTKLLKELVEYFESNENDLPEYEADILTRFLKELKNIMISNEKGE